MKMNFDIFVSKTEDHYRAVCPAFPECIGEGESEAEATEDLGNVITLHLSDTVRRTIDDVRQLGLLHRVSSLPVEVSSKSDTESPVGKESVFEEARDLFGKVIFSGKLPISPDLIKRLDKKQLGNRIKKIMGIGGMGMPGLLGGMPPLFDDVQLPFQTELVDEGLMFGVPLSLN